MKAARQGASYLMATQTAALAAPYIFATGQEVVPLGGFTGTVSEPSPAALADMVSAGRFRLALLTSPGVSQSTSWIAGHCLPVGPPTGSSPSVLVQHLAVYYCNA
jgi:hypothetical protein